MDDRDDARQVVVWQKVNGGMRSVLLNRTVPRISFLTGILLYAGEGTKSTASARVEIANSSPNIHRLFIAFLDDLGVPKERLKARIQIHDPDERIEGKEYWLAELPLQPNKFSNPLLSVTKKGNQKRTCTLQLSYCNTMLLMLLRHWTAHLEDMVRLAENQQRFESAALAIHKTQGLHAVKGST